MVGLVESLAQQLVHRTTDPFGLAILTGVASSSFWFFGTFVLSLDGTLPATITELERAKKDISNTSALKLWEWMFYRGMVRFCCLDWLISSLRRSWFLLQIRFATAGIMSGTSYFVASIFRPDLRPILYGASLLSFSITPYSLVICKCWIPLHKVTAN